jgi:hypothetical protein
MSRKESNVHEQVMKQNIMKEEFGWEIPVESVPLPSRGILYSPDSTLFNREIVPIKAMTAHEEDILTSQAFIKEGTVINQLIKSCVTDKSFDVDDMTIGDRNALMIAIRITGYGPDYNVNTSCENCSHVNNVTVNLSDLGIKRLSIKPVKDGKNEFEFALPVTKKKVTFKFLTLKDESDRTISNRNEQAAFGVKLEKNVTSYLKYTLLSVGGVTDKSKLHHFVTYMPAFDSKALRKFINDNEPGMDMGAHYDCEKCTHRNGFNLPITSEFFWPST